MGRDVQSLLCYTWVFRLLGRLRLVRIDGRVCLVHAAPKNRENDEHTPRLLAA